MPRPSESVLRWLRDLMQKREVSAAALAERSGLPRNRVRHVLAGAEPMTLDEFMQVTRALDVKPSDLGLDGVSEDAPVQDDEPASPDALVAGPGVIPVHLEPLGNHPRQLFEVGFALGCDFLFLARADALSGSGVPASVLDAYAGRDLPIKLDAAYHVHNKPTYEEGGISLVLSFDALYTCRFPWSAIRQIVFFPAPPLESSSEEEEDEPPEPPPGPPRLRLVR